MLSLASRISRTCHAACLAFDMRGSGSSKGWPTLTGSSEVSDVISAAAFLRGEFPRLSDKLFILGYSAGACIGGSASPEVKPLGYIGIGYPCGVLASVAFSAHPARLLQFEGRKLFILGSSDFFTSESRLRLIFGSQNKTEIRILPNIGHFDIICSEKALCDSISAFIQTACLD